LHNISCEIETDKIKNKKNCPLKTEGKIQKNVFNSYSFNNILKTDPLILLKLTLLLKTDPLTN